MRTLLFTLVVIAVVLSVSAKKSYTGYKVIRLSTSTEKLIAANGDFQDFIAYKDLSSSVFQVAEAHLLDVWAANALQGWMDVMIPPHLVNSTTDLFSALPYKVVIPDVQQSIDVSEAARKLSSNKADFFSDFQTYDVITEWINTQAKSNPTKASVISIGKSYLGNEIYALDMGKGAGKPTVVIQCGIHAREWVSPTTCCWIIDQILNQDPNGGGKLLDTFEIVIIPVLNIDGYAYTHSDDRLWRKNRQPTSDPKCVGTDLNRNYGYEWSKPGASGNPCSDTYYGSAAFSGPEIALVRDLLAKYKSSGELISYWDIHAYSGLWMSPWGYACNLPPNYQTMFANMQSAVTAVRDVNGNKYDFGSICQTIYQASGGSTDYSFAIDGVIHSYAVEASGTSFTPAPSNIPYIGSEIYAGVKTSIGLYKPQ